MLAIMIPITDYKAVWINLHYCLLRQGAGVLIA